MLKKKKNLLSDEKTQSVVCLVSETILCGCPLCQNKDSSVEQENDVYEFLEEKTSSSAIYAASSSTIYAA